MTNAAPARPFTVQTALNTDDDSSAVAFMWLDARGAMKVRPFGRYSPNHANAVAEMVGRSAEHQYDRTGSVPTLEDVRRMYLNAATALRERVVREGQRERCRCAECRGQCRPSSRARA